MQDSGHVEVRVGNAVDAGGERLIRTEPCAKLYMDMIMTSAGYKGDKTKVVRITKS